MMSGVETKILSQLEVNAIRPEQSWAVPPIVLGPGLAMVLLMIFTLLDPPPRGFVLPQAQIISKILYHDLV